MGDDSNHSLIFLELDPFPIKPPNPFKLNPSQLKEPSTLDLLKENRLYFSSYIKESSTIQFQHNLKTSRVSLSSGEKISELDSKALSSIKLNI